MNPLHTLLSTLALLAAAALPAQTTPESRLVDALNRFAADLHGQLAATPEGPTCSPASISFALLMLLPGARGETTDEIANVLRLPAELRGETLVEAAKGLLQRTARVGNCGFGAGPQLRITNDFWGQTGHEFVAEYTELLRHAFGSHAFEVDFENDAEAARRSINARIADATNQRIRELIPAGMITPATRTVISNAIWYRGKWVHEFYRPEKLAPFHVSAERTVDVSMMYVKKDFWYAESPAWQAVALPMDDRAVQFEVVLPRAGRSLADAERALLSGDHMRRRAATLVQVGMPAFRVRGSHRLRGPLQALGLRSAFVPGAADFTGIDRTEPLVIDDVVHGTWIDVDEIGVEAAAATAVVLKAGAAIREDPKVLLADRPFAFGLRDHRTGLLLFVGRVTDPTAGP